MTPLALRQRVALAAITVFAAAVYCAHLAGHPFPIYYGLSVRSMSQSWHAWFFGALDPASSVTLDKLPGAFQIQALWVRIFGFHPWAIALPQVIEGVVSLLALFQLVRRWRGPTAGLLAALLFALTPITASVFGHTMEDGALTCFVLLAAERTYAAASGSKYALLVAAFWLGLAFEVKMAQALVVGPALVAAFLLGQGISRRAWAKLGGAAAVFTVVGGWWIALLEFVPTGSRPFVDGTTNDSALTMVFGYNGLDRLGVHLSGSVQGVYPGMVHDASPEAPWRTLLDGRLGTQIAWVLPIALLGLALVLRRRDAADHAAVVLFGAWLLPTVVLVSAVKIPHAAYLASLAAPIAGLAAVGLLELHRSTGWRLLAACACAQAAWTLWLWSPTFGFAPYVLVPALIAAGAALVALRWRRSLAFCLAMVVMLAGSAAWTLSTFNSRMAGTDIEAAAGPVQTHRAGTVTPEQKAQFGVSGSSFIEPTATLSADGLDLLSTIQAAGGGPLASVGWYLAQGLVFAGQPVRTMGGFSLQVPAPTIDEFTQLVGDGRVRFVLAGAGALGGYTSTASANAEIVTWISKNCANIWKRIYPDSQGGQSGVFLFDCRAISRSARS